MNSKEKQFQENLRRARVVYAQAILDTKRETPAQPSNIEAWLSDPRLDQYLGSTATMKLEILAAILRADGTPLARIAEARGVTRAAASYQSRQARRIFGLAK